MERKRERKKKFAHIIDHRELFDHLLIESDHLRERQAQAQAPGPGYASKFGTNKPKKHGDKKNQ